MNTKCRECGCPHTTIFEHVAVSDRFFLAERHCDNCSNIWLSIEKQEQTKKYDKKNDNDNNKILESKFRELALATRNTFLEILDGLSHLDKKIEDESLEIKKLQKLLKDVDRKAEGKD